MVLATTGRKSGERRLVPFNFAEDGGAICNHSKCSSTHDRRRLIEGPPPLVGIPASR
jgi:hypothetical protein